MKINFQEEKLYQVIDECKTLIHMHWKEIALNQDKIKLNPDWRAYSYMESLGKLRIYTARDEDNSLVGYFVVTLTTNMHYRDNIFAENDVIYLHPDYRRGLTGVKLIRFAIEELKQEKVDVVKINVKKHKDFGPLLVREGFSPIETVYSKYIGE